MSLFYQDNHIRIFNKDCRSMDELPDESVQVVVTSPPYFGLRKYSGDQELIWGDNHCEHQWIDYKTSLIHENGNFQKGTQEEVIAGGRELTHIHKYSNLRAGFCSLCGAWKGQLGHEPTIELYLLHTIEILRKIKRVLRKDGVVFWNIADTYFSNPSNQQGRGFGKIKAGARGAFENIGRQKRISANGILKPKDLCLIPQRVMIAAQEDAWWVRSVIIWNKLNPMPESVKDRATKSHEYIIMLTKSARYFFDQEAVREVSTERPSGNKERKYRRDYGGPEAHTGRQGFSIPYKPNGTGRNIHSVWEFPAQPFPGIRINGKKVSPFAVFPEKLPELCIKAATPEVGCCSKCGAPWTRVIKKGFTDHDGATRTTYPEGSSANRLALLRQVARGRGAEYQNTSETIGWKPTCNCNAPRAPSLVLDPLMGSGTTLLVAKKLNRLGCGYELSQDYCKLAVERCRQQVLL